MTDAALDLFDWWNLHDGRHAGLVQVERLARLVVGGADTDGHRRGRVWLVEAPVVLRSYSPEPVPVSCRSPFPDLCRR